MAAAELISLQIRICDLKDFFDHVVLHCGADIVDVERRREAGEFEELDDYENALYAPFARQEIAARAVYYEINALIEKELQQSATPAWLESDKYTGPKRLVECRDPAPEALRDIRTIEDLRFGEILKLIKKKYGVDVRDLEGAQVVFRVREIVNNFKHRDGVVDFRKTEDPLRNMLRFERHRVDIEEAYDALDGAYRFIRALWKATDREPKRSAYKDPDLMDVPDLEYLEEVIARIFNRSSDAT